ncbi:3271_t:CDS:2, partial [Cetraspora pellucida]
MPQKSSNRKSYQNIPSDDESGNSPDQDGGDDIVQIFTAFNNLKDRMEKRVKDKQRKLSSECDSVIQQISEFAHELVSRQKQEIDAKINEYKRKYEELDEEKLTIVKKLRSEEAKYLQLHDSIICELDKIDLAQMETNQEFEKKYLSFID